MGCGDFYWRGVLYNSWHEVSIGELGGFRLQKSRGPNSGAPPNVCFVSSIRPNLAEFTPQYPSSRANCQSPLPSAVQRGLHNQASPSHGSQRVYPISSQRRSPSATILSPRHYTRQAIRAPHQDHNPSQTPTTSCHLDRLEDHQGVQKATLPTEH